MNGVSMWLVAVRDGCLVVYKAQEHQAKLLKEPTMGRKKQRNIKKSKKVEKTETQSTRQASSLNEALYLWLSRRPASIQNTILVVFGICAVLFFSAKVLDLVKIMKPFLPTGVRRTYGVICNRSDQDVTIEKTGHYTIHASPPVRGEFYLDTITEIDSNQITLPGNGGEVEVYAEISNTPEVRKCYDVGTYPVTLRFDSEDQLYAIMAKIDKFSKAGLREKWKTSTHGNMIPETTIKVCIEKLSDSSKRSIVLNQPDLSELEDKVLLESETKTFINDLLDKIERRQFFGMISMEYYDEVLHQKELPQPFTVMAKIAIGIYEKENSEKIILVNVTDTEHRIKNGDAHYSRSYSSQSPEERILQTITDATRAIIAEYPIEGRISEVYAEKSIVEIGVGRLAGIRNYLHLYAYSGDIQVGEVEVTASWPGTCEGKWISYLGHEADTSFLVCSRKKDSK